MGDCLQSNLALHDCKLVKLPVVSDYRGNLTFIEGIKHLPFSFKRIYYLYDIPGGSIRGGHAHKNLQQFIIALSGSFDLHLNDGLNSKTFHLNHPSFGVLICPLIWRVLDNFSSGSVCMVLASDFYDESDYFRDYDEFKSSLKL